MTALATLLGAVADLERRDPVDYAGRNRLIVMAMAAATMDGVTVGIGHDPKAPEWPVVYFELPVVGQVAFHLPEHPMPWDGHTKGQALERLDLYRDAFQKLNRELGWVMREQALDLLPSDPTRIDCAERYEGAEQPSEEEV